MTDPEIHTETTQGVLLTADGYSRLHKELEDLTTIKRPEIADRIRESQQHGEFSEDNHELDEVKFEQAMIESRIAELKALFGGAQVLEEAHIPTDHVGFGSRVRLLDIQWDDEFTVQLVSSIEADPARDLLSNESPMGTAIFGAQVNDLIAFSAPDGVKKLKILEISL